MEPQPAQDKSNTKACHVRSANPALLLGAIVVVVLVAILSFAGKPLITDDASIVLVYAHHLTTGQGLVWNDTAVEGYTSTLDLLIKSLWMLLLDDPIKMSFWWSLALHVACPLMAMRGVFLLTQQLKIPSPLSVCWIAAGGLAVASSASLAYGSSFLLETPLFVLLGLALVIGMLSERVKMRQCLTVSLCAAALAWTRPEGILLALVALGVFLYEHRHNLTRLMVAVIIGPFMLTTAALLVFRRVYFGYWVPNTYYAKSSDSRWSELEEGVLYLIQGSDSLLGIVLISLSIFGWLVVSNAWWKHQQTRGAARMCTLLAAAAVLSVVVGGGDSYGDTRFLALPFILSALLLAFIALGSRAIPRAVALNGLAALILLQCVSVFSNLDDSFWRIGRWPHDLSDYHCDREFSDWLDKSVPELAIAQSDFQRLKLFNDRLQVVDLRGLNDVHIAHQPWDGVNRWGKFNHDVAISVDAPIWLWGRRLKTGKPMADYPLDRLILDAKLLTYFTDWPDVPIVGFTAAGQMMRENYLTASVAVCNGYYNFLAHKDIGARLRSAGALVGK